MATAPVHVQTYLNDLPFSRRQRLVLWLCFLVVAVDGFDTAAIGFVAPSLRAEWGLTAAALAPLFGAGLVGLMMGALIFGPLADRWGRKLILVGSVAFFGLMSLASVWATDLSSLVALRFLTGLGLGGAMPSAITMTSEYCPERRRSRLVTLMFCGFTLGSALGGLASAQILAQFGWRGVFLIGGLLPLALLPFLWVLLPESLRFLVLRNRPLQTIESVVRQLNPGAPAIPRFVADAAPGSTPIAELFRAPYAVGTALLWLAYFMSLLIIYLISSWLPTLLTSAGASVSKASLVTSVFQIGGTIGAILLGRWMDNVGSSRALALAYVLGAGFVVLCGLASTNLALLVLAVFGVGFCISGSQVGVNALAASYYPTSSRATVVSWANAAGRTGSVVGSIAGGWLMSMNFDMAAILSMLALPALLAAAAIGLMGRSATVRHRNTAAAETSNESV